MRMHDGHGWGGHGHSPLTVAVAHVEQQQPQADCLLTFSQPMAAQHRVLHTAQLHIAALASPSPHSPQLIATRRTLRPYLVHLVHRPLLSSLPLPPLSPWCAPPTRCR